MENDIYVEWRKNQNIRPAEIPNKSKLYHDLMNIEHSLSGRMDTNVGNTFILEADQLLVNSIELFETGYFDCAYFSLRSAIDISTTMVFLCDLDYDKKSEYLEKWKNIEDFPQRLEMIKELSKNGDVFADMYTNMKSFFEDAKETSQKLNKYVHKQGLQNLYISKNHPMNTGNSQDEFISAFLYFLKKAIGIVAVMRLAIDPFPILLMDEEILYRCFDSMTEPYSEDFVNEYIGKDVVFDYKKTDLFIDTYDYFIINEKKNEVVFNITKHQIIDTTKYDVISKQFHLMTNDDVIVTKIACACDKIAKVYAIGGFLMYFTDRKTRRTKTVWSGMQFREFSASDQKYNQPFDEVYISAFRVGDQDYYAEHNDLLTDAEITQIESKIKSD